MNSCALTLRFWLATAQSQSPDGSQRLMFNVARNCVCTLAGFYAHHLKLYLYSALPKLWMLWDSEY
jgi:hypothetical protein